MKLVVPALEHIASRCPALKSGWSPDKELATIPGNLPSQRMIEANGGRLVERFIIDPQLGADALRYPIDLRPKAEDLK